MHMLVEHISLVIGVIGLTVILWGVLLGVLRLLRLEWASLSGRNILVEREDLRHHLGYYLLLGLEFLIAADIVHTLLISAPDWFLLIVLRKGLPRRCFTIDWATSLESKKQALRFVSIT